MFYNLEWERLEIKTWSKMDLEILDLQMLKALIYIRIALVF